VISMDRPDFGGLRASYRRTFAEHGDTPAAVQWPKGRQELRWAALTSHIPAGAQGCFLDFGCGLGHFKAYVDTRYPGSRYAGADVVPEFIDHARSRDPSAEWILLDDVEELTGEYDWIVLSGVFNKLCFSNRAQHQAYVDRVLGALLRRARISLSVDFMTDRVDWQQPGAYHESLVRIRALAQEMLSPRLCIDESYMPYEFALTVFRDTAILRPDNIYRP
jgi:trans-aconitate methyltransferase